MMHFYDVTTRQLRCIGFTQADQTKQVDSVHWKKSQRVHNNEAFVVCKYFSSNGEDGMVVCVTVSLHNPQILACVTIPRCYVNAMLFWISQLHWKRPLNVTFSAHVFSGILSPTVSSFLPVVNCYLACLRVDVYVHFRHAYTSATVKYGKGSATCSAMAESRAPGQGSFSGPPMCPCAAAIKRVSIELLRTTINTRSLIIQTPVLAIMRKMCFNFCPRHCCSHSCWITQL